MRHRLQGKALTSPQISSSHPPPFPNNFFFFLHVTSLPSDAAVRNAGSARQEVIVQILMMTVVGEGSENVRIVATLSTVTCLSWLCLCNISLQFCNCNCNLYSALLQLACLFCFFWRLKLNNWTAIQVLWFTSQILRLFIITCLQTNLYIDAHTCSYTQEFKHCCL